MATAVVQPRGRTGPGRAGERALRGARRRGVRGRGGSTSSSGATSRLADRRDDRRRDRDDRRGSRARDRRDARCRATDGFVVTLQDVTARASRCASSSETVGQLEDIMDNSAALIYVKDTEGRYMVVNHHFERRFGLRREDVIGRTDREVFPLRRRDGLRGPRPPGHAHGRGDGGRGARDRPGGGRQLAVGQVHAARPRRASPTRWAASRPTSPTASAPRPPRARRATRPSAPTRPRASSSRA